MRTALATVANRRAVRQRSASLLSAVPPAQDSTNYLPQLAVCAASIVYKSPLPSPEGHPIFIVNAAALPDIYEVDYDSLLPYVLARLPGEDDLLHGTEYEIIFFAGGQPDNATTEKKQGPGIGWYLQAYNVLSRAMRKRLKRLYIVHTKTWVRVLISVFSTVVSPKFRRKVAHISNLSALERHTPIANLLVPPAVYLYDRRLEDEIDTMTIGVAFGTRHPLPRNPETGEIRLPRILRETSKFLLEDSNLASEGLFRIPPHSVLTDILKEAYDRGQKFIVWRERDATLIPLGIDPALGEEITISDAYGVNAAAALIKAWYRELREPIFSESSYPYLRSNFADASSITVEKLFTLFSPQSATSVLTTTSREIVIRHLIPLLAIVADHEHDNKMSASNLAICFAMALLRGLDQMEDAKMTSVIRNLLTAAIMHWQQLREMLGIGSSTFHQDLENPSNSQLYEDPLPDEQIALHTSEDAFDRWINVDAEDDSEQKPADSAFHVPRIVQRLPLMSRAPESTREAAPPPVPRRKPAPALNTNSNAEPPRNSPISSDSASTTQGTTPVSSNLSPDNDLAPFYVVTGSRSDLKPLPPVPKRKAVATENNDVENANLQQANAARASEMTDSNTSDPVISSELPPEPVFRKPSWPASSTRLPPKLPSLAKPVLPIIQSPSSTIPTTNLMSPSFPKPRAPSPNLLRRMNTIEALGLHIERTPSLDEDKKYKLEPSKLSLKKASVDDLRRLYEERLTTVHGLAKATIVNRSYSQS